MSQLHLLMTHRAAGTIAALTALIALAAVDSAHAEVGVNVFGISRHLKNPLDEELREFNPGLGLNWTFSQAGRGSLEGNVGIYQDSYGHANYHLSLGGRVRVAGPFDLGLQLINASSASFNDGEPVLTPYPFLAARLPGATLNVAYIPEIRSINAMPSLATYVTVFPWPRPEGDDARQAAPAGAGSALEFEITRLADIEGYDSAGFLWRHMFDESNGLRLGVRIDGRISTTDYDDWSTGPDGEYTASMLAQYLNRRAARGRWRPYWATGLETRFSAGDGREAVREAWRTDLGVEYRLVEGVALAVEYGLELAYAWREGYAYENFAGPAGRSLTFAGTGARLVLLASRGEADAAGTAEASQPLSGPVVLLGPNLETYPLFVGAAVAWHWRPSPTRGWRVALQPEINASHADQRRDQRYTFEVRGERLFRRPGASGTAAYWGLGPVARFNYTEYHYVDEEEQTGVDINRSGAFGLTALVGAEFPVTKGLYVLAEYSTDLTWFTFNNSNYVIHGWGIAANHARLGLASAF